MDNNTWDYIPVCKQMRFDTFQDSFMYKLSA